MRSQDHVFMAPDGRIEGVLFDVHSTLIDQGSAAQWLECADPSGAFRDQVTPDLEQFLSRVWENAREFDPASERDLDPSTHYRVFHDLIEHGAHVSRPFADRLYETLLDPWHAYADAVPTLQQLRDMGVRVVLLSNIGIDIDHVLQREGLADVIDGRVFSLEVGHVKPEREIFEAALHVLNVPAQRALMVGDSPKDDVGAAALGIRTLILPRTAGPVHGLGIVPAMVAADYS
jgi:HAD superfamily hydrolase (TIGR01509 family)